MIVYYLQGLVDDLNLLKEQMSQKSRQLGKRSGVRFHENE